MNLWPVTYIGLDFLEIKVVDKSNQLLCILNMVFGESIYSMRISCQPGVIPDGTLLALA